MSLLLYPSPFVAHAESPWMVLARRVARGLRWLALGLACGAAIDLSVRVLVG